MKTSKTGMIIKLYKVKILYIYMQYGTSILLTTQPDTCYESNKKINIIKNIKVIKNYLILLLKSAQCINLKILGPSSLPSLNLKLNYLRVYTTYST